MKNKISATIAITFLLVTVAAFAANFTDDTLQIGKPGSSADKSVVFGASNKKKLSHKPSTQTLDYEGNNLSVGDGLNTSDKTLKLNKGANSPTFRHNFTSGDLEIENAPVLNQKGNTVSVGDGTNTNKVLKFNKGASSPEIRYNSTTGKLQFTNDTTTYKDIGSGSGGGGGTNLLQEFNSDFESGSPPQNWTASGGTFITETTDPLFGLQSGSWDSNASSQTLSSQLVTIEKGFIGKKCTADIEYKWPSGVAGDLSFQVVDQVPNILATVVLEPTTGSNTRKAFLAFDCPSVATDQLRVRLLSNVANPALIVVDNAFVGVNKSTTNVSQARFFGGAEQTGGGSASCFFTEGTSSGETNFVSLNTGSGCNAWTVEGGVTAVGTNDHRIVVNNLPAGRHQVIITGPIWQSGAGTCSFQLYDGTTGWQPQLIEGAANTQHPVLSFHPTYVSAGTRTFEVRAADNFGGSCGFRNEISGRVLSWKVYSFPANGAEALNLETTGQSWSGYHDSTCGWARGNVAYGDLSTDASCALVERTNSGFGTVTTQAGTLPGIVFNAPGAAKYWVCANATSDQGTAGEQYFLRLYDGTNTISETNFQDVLGSTGQLRPTSMICGIYNATSAGTKTISIQAKSSAGGTITVQGLGGNAIEWSIIRMDQAFPAPVFTEVRNKINATTSGVRHFGARVTCSNSASAILTQDGSDIASITNGVSAGNCTINFAQTYSQIPSCVCTAVGGTGNYCQFVSAGTSSYSFQNVLNGNAANGNIHLLCSGK